MLVSIILPTVRADSVGTAIDAIIAQTVDEWELIVVPQGDDDRLASVLAEYTERHAQVHAVHTPVRGLSHARNVGTAAARGDILAFTDDDCEVAPDWVERLQQIFAEHPDVGVVGGEVVAPPNRQWWRVSTCPAAHVIDAVYRPVEDGWQAPPGFYMIGANISVRRDVADRVGLWDVEFGAGRRYGACEDQDFISRAEALGVSLLTSSALVVNHTTGRRHGLRQFVAHQRNYARGRGAWQAKLRMWGHPVMRIWDAEPHSAGIKTLFRRPDKWLLSRFEWHHIRLAAHEYHERFVLGDDVLTHPRPAPSHPAAVAERAAADTVQP
ncbi:MAG TPA: glycosyltransferase family 2 protein [Ilumatobacter sp.]|nr:glycosyltransferase family 2 protein [Ilumatobacter sp.]